MWKCVIRVRSQFQLIEVFEDDETGFVALLLNRELQFYSANEYRYHEALAHVPMMFARNAKKVLILGGGDGLLARELLKYPELEITICDIDPEVVAVCREEPVKKINQGSLEKVNLIYHDAYELVKSGEKYDVIIADLPDPMCYSMDRLYSVEFYRNIYNRLNPDGVFCTQAMDCAMPIGTAQIYANVREVFPKVYAYHVQLINYPHGFVLGVKNSSAVLNKELKVETKHIDEKMLAGMFLWGKEERKIFEGAKPDSVFASYAYQLALRQRIYPLLKGD